MDNGVRAYKFNKVGGSYTGFSFATGQPGITYDPERHLLWSSHWNDRRFRAFNPDTGALVFTSPVMAHPNGDKRGHDISVGAGRIWVSTEEPFPGSPASPPVADVIYSFDIIGGAVDEIVECHTTYTDPGFTVTDNCGAIVTTTGTVNTAAVGTYTITYTATDSAGNTTLRTRTITVLDTTPPVVTCPPNITVNNDAGQCSAVVNFTVTATDTCGSATVLSTPPSGSTFPKGTTIVNSIATDSHGNTASCSFTVTVIDNQAPVISTPASISQSTDPGQCSAVVTFPVAATDNCPGVTVSASPASGTVFAKGVTTVTLTATDAVGNVTTSTFTVTVTDNQPPTIPVAASNLTVECDGLGNTSQLNAWLANHGGASASDNCPGVSWTQNFTAQSNGCGNTGLATVIFTATDASGNVSTTTATFTIVDTTAPSITTPASNLTVESDGAGNTAQLNAWIASHGGASASDICAGVTWTHNFAALSDGCGATGTATVIFTATDECGNASITTATFTIIDTTPPAISPLASSSTVETDGAGNTAQLNAWLASSGGASATDVGGSVTWTHNFTALSDGCGATGTATVIFTATDECGNASITTATFTIIDTTPPAISPAASNLTVECDGSGNTAQLNAWLLSHGGASATDIGGNVTWTHNFAALSDGCGHTGTATVAFTATDECGNSSSTTATFTIVDTTAPAVTVPAGNQIVECDGAGNVAQLQAWLDSHGGAAASDICGGVTWSHNFTALSDDCGETGSAPVTFTATDACGNSSSTTATFTIVDTTAPEITFTLGGSNPPSVLSGTYQIYPKDVPISFTVTTEDVCGTSGVALSYTCTAINSQGKIIDRSSTCKVTINGGNVLISQSGGVGNLFTITAVSTDECGNMSEKKLVIKVLRPANEGVGNGVDGNTPGHDNNGGNDDPGFTPGNPGAKSKPKP